MVTPFRHWLHQPLPIVIIYWFRYLFSTSCQIGIDFICLWPLWIDYLLFHYCGTRRHLFGFFPTNNSSADRSRCGLSSSSTKTLYLNNYSNQSFPCSYWVDLVFYYIVLFLTFYTSFSFSYQPVWWYHRYELTYI